jgi:hypothetical protein
MTDDDMTVARNLSKTICDALVNPHAAAEDRAMLHRLRSAPAALDALPPRQRAAKLAESATMRFVELVRASLGVAPAASAAAGGPEQEAAAVVDPAVAARLAAVALEARDSCRVWPVPRPGSARFFGVGDFAGDAPPRAPTRRAREADDAAPDAGGRAAETAADSARELQRLFAPDEPPLTGVAFSAAAVAVAAEPPFVARVAALLHAAGARLDRRAGYATVRAVVVVALQLLRRCQCYAQCALDVQSRIGARGAALPAAAPAARAGDVARGSAASVAPLAVRLVRAALRRMPADAPARADAELLLDARRRPTFAPHGGGDGSPRLSARDGWLYLMGALTASRSAARAAVLSVES